jgi:hypothetical protein
VLDVSVSYNRYKFIGHEFLTWLWFVLENQTDRVSELSGKGDPTELEIGNRVVLERRMGNDALESVTIQGDHAGLEEGMLALKKGALVTEINLVLRVSEWRWQFTLQGESLHLKQIQLPETGPVETPEEVEGAVLERMALFERITETLDGLFRQFIADRTSDTWSSDTLPRLKAWISR